ncbi:thioredoxin domain-containing protein [Candidatus Eisenbacteria bacterium]|uniref:Thioredoxin domain-containing protein n=1 Tax=Eiseniibacteriota bacterium TaxID=2212470 RepID=A0ABV6YJW7_UNCEI
MSTESGSAHHQHTNRLIKEKSPYLLQHAHNPVDWYPWGEEAHRKARDEDKPIFLSIGYSTCHWCHVMERESFENEEIARLINENFIPIKVDREERPDIDNLYMTAVQAMTGSGGWPMTVFLTPDLQPFYSGTYFPPDERWGRPGLRTILTSLAQAYTEKRDEVNQAAAAVTDVLRNQALQVSTGDAVGPGLDEKPLHAAYEALRGRHDTSLGGFGAAPKFPTPHNLTFLLRYAKRTGKEDAQKMALATLDAMAAGGIHDHLGGGFHRYSTDAHWLVPHFEKMLYDQAGLAIAYTDAWLVTRNETYAHVVRDILDYVMNYLTDPDGAFYSAEDADSEGEEGTFYVWTMEEIISRLGDEEGQQFAQAYGAQPDGNWESKNILNRSAAGAVHAPEFDKARKRLLDLRDKRERPHRDEKIIVAWNGFMIEAFARAGRALDEPRYTHAAEKAAEFIEKNLWQEGRLLRHYRDGAADIAGYIDDYAFLGRGLVALYESTFEPRYLRDAIRVAKEMDRLFQREAGGFSFTGTDAETLLAPVVEIYDGAMPSGNSAAAGFLLRLGHLTADTELEQQGREVLRTFHKNMEHAPGGHVEMLSALDFALGPITEVVLAGESSDKEVGALLRTVRGRYLPNSVTAFRPTKDAQGIVALIPYLEVQTTIDNKATAYVCRDYACRLPVHDPESLRRQLDAD